jgi:TPR repeat protein
MRASARARITAVRYSVALDHVRVVIQFDGVVQYQAGTAVAPDRIFFDLPSTEPAPTLVGKVFVNDPVLQRIRVAQYQPGVTRAVLDVTKPVSYTTSFATDPPRLLIDLSRSAADQPASELVTAVVANSAAPAAAGTAAMAGTQTSPGQPQSANLAVSGASVALSTREDSRLAARFADGAKPLTDPAATARAYLQAAQQGSIDAQYQLGNLYMNGNGVARDPAEAARWYTHAAQQGHAVAASNLGVLYAKGWGVPQSDAEAVNWFRKAADAGDAGGENNLGSMCIAGRGVAQSDALGARWVFSAAQHGAPEAQYTLGTLYANGRGVPRDDAQAVQWLKAAAAQGYAPAQLALGKMYAAGAGVPRDFAEAMRNFRNADTPEAWYQLGLLYQQGLGTARSDAEAAVWWLKAAERGLAEAQYAIGRLYLDRDTVEAYSWFALAAAAGDQDGVAAMNSLTPLLTAEQLADAQQRALAIAQPRH